jgi:general secretion pathway protein G
MRRARGFTLLEMIVVLTIIGLLMALVGPRIFGAGDRAKVDAATIQIKTLAGALQTFRLDLGRFPTKEEGLPALLKAPAGLEGAQRTRWRGPYTDPDQLTDPWQNPMQYSLPGAGGKPFALYSFGADGKKGGEGNDADVGDLPP